MRGRWFARLVIVNLLLNMQSVYMKKKQNTLGDYDCTPLFDQKLDCNITKKGQETQLLGSVRNYFGIQKDPSHIFFIFTCLQDLQRGKQRAICRVLFRLQGERVFSQFCPCPSKSCQQPSLFHVSCYSTST